jgi:hypothetical protein
MPESTPKVGPTLADAPEESPKEANVFGYDVASQSKNVSAQKPNPASPLAAG